MRATPDRGADGTASSGGRGVLLVWILAGAMYALTLSLFGLHAALVLFEDGDFRPAARSDSSAVLWSLAAMIGVNLVLPWALSRDPRMKLMSYRHPSELHGMCATCAMVSMIAYMLIIEPTGGRRPLLSLTIPAMLIPIGTLLAWRACQIGAQAVGSPPRDVSDWTVLDHLRGRQSPGD